MKKFGLVFVMLVLVLVFGLVLISCDDGSGNSGGGTQGGGNTNVARWPEDFFYSINQTTTSSDWNTVTEPNKLQAPLYFRQGTASGIVSFNNDTEFRLVTVQGKKLTVRCTLSPGSNIAVVGQEYIFCTDYTVSGNTITLVGSTISDRRLGPVLTRAR